MGISELEVQPSTTCDVCEKIADCYVLDWAKLCPTCFDREKRYEEERYEPDWRKLTALDYDGYGELVTLAEQLERLKKLKMSSEEHGQQLAELLAPADVTEQIDRLEKQVDAAQADVRSNLKHSWIRWKQSKDQYEGLTTEEHENWKIDLSEIYAWVEDEYKHPGVSPFLSDGFYGNHWEPAGIWERAKLKVEARLRNTLRMRKARAANRRRRKDKDRKRVSLAADKAEKLAKEDARKLKDKLRKREKAAAKKV